MSEKSTKGGDARGRARDGHDRGRLRVGISSCLLGHEVRFDGGHKRDLFLIGGLGAYVEWVPVCPEVEVGMGIPRPSVRLERVGEEIRMVDPRSGTDHTRAMTSFSRRRVGQLERLDLCGYVLKNRSPSCGMERVKVVPAAGGVGKRDGRGLFAEQLMASMPHLAVEEEGRLKDPRLRENFVERIFAARRLAELFRPRWRHRDVVDFHADHKLQLMAHWTEAYRRLGRFVARVKEVPRAEFQRDYATGFMAALGRMATPGRNTNTLQHMAGYFRKSLDASDRSELADLIERYRLSRVPLVVPLTLIRHHARRLEIEYLLRQSYLDPHPDELMLRNHV